MPIINGTYVNDSLPDPKQAQAQVFGDGFYSRKDMAGYTQAAYNYLMKQQEQAYNLDLWNMYNEYWTPQNQMSRFQSAGLNPNLIYGQAANATQSPASASAPTYRDPGTMSKSMQVGLGVVNQLVNTVKTARDLYDYTHYGAETSRWQMIGAQESALGQKLQNAWEDYLLHGDNMIYGDSQRLVNGPRAKYFNAQTSRTQNQAQQSYQAAERLKGLVSMIDDEKIRLQLQNDILEYQGKIMHGQNDAILNINTGSGFLDAVLKAYMFFLQGMGLSISGKFSF